MYSAGSLRGGRIEQVKGRTYGLADLLDSSAEATRFTNGSYVTLYLSPRDYHRIHCPVAGRITHFRYVPGRLFPVNAMGLRLVDGLFAVNERLISYLETDLGPFAVVKVGATNVGMITTSYHPVRTNQGGTEPYDERMVPPVELDRGDELAMFHLGSTVVLLAADPDVVPVSFAPDEYVRNGSAASSSAARLPEPGGAGCSTLVPLRFCRLTDLAGRALQGQPVREVEGVSAGVEAAASLVAVAGVLELRWCPGSPFVNGLLVMSNQDLRPPASP